MPRRRPRRRLREVAIAAWLVQVAVRSAALAVALSILPAVSPSGVEAAPPRESCAPGETTTVSGFGLCSAQGGDGGLNIGGLVLPIVVGVVIAGLGVALLAFLVIERRTTRNLAPVQPGEWWTCGNCGKENLVGSPRCYACGAWQA
jgi:hypothetical protein